MKLLWLDLETTGLDPNTDRILEVAFGFADLEAPFSLEYVARRVIRDSGEGLTPFIVDMHTKNGLLRDCAFAIHSLGDVESDLLDRTEGEADKLTLAGNSVHFDLAFIRRRMPTFAKRLSHRVYDVSAVKLFARSMGMPEGEKGPEPHRAKEDVLASVQQARQLSEWLHHGPGFSPRYLPGA